MQLKVTSLDSRGFGKAKDSKGNLYKILGALPNEVVTARSIKKSKKNIFAVVDEVIESSPFRIEPKDPESYLSSSVWQILKLDKENIFKTEIVKSEFGKFTKNFNAHEKTLIDNFQVISQDESDSWNYRNKVELQFCLIENGAISYALYNQGESWQKSPMEESSIFSHSINKAAHKILDFIKRNNLHIDDLRYLILRSGQNGVVALLCLKSEVGCEALEELLDENITGFMLAMPKSDSYEILHKIGHCEMQEQILDKTFYSDFDHFFQINISIFELVIRDIKNLINKLNLKKPDLMLVDLFAGVGVIGLLLSEYFKKVVCVEISSGTKEFALRNARMNSVQNFEFYESDIDSALDLIQKADVLVLDPPRGGLTKNCLDSIKRHLPKYIIYLSCNHETFVKDLAHLNDIYEVKFLKGYNFFPHTPHVECLSFLQIKW